MLRKRIIFPILFLIFSPSLAMAENSPFYIGINAASFESTTTDTSQTETSTSYDGAMLNFGYDINNYFSLELLTGASSSADESPTISSKIDYTGGVYARFNLRFNRVTLSLLGGYATTGISTTVGNTTTSDSESGQSAGIGIDFYGTRDLALSLRTMILYAKDNPGGGDTVLSATTFGITYYFDKPKIHSRY